MTRKAAGTRVTRRPNDEMHHSHLHSYNPPKKKKSCSHLKAQILTSFGTIYPLYKNRAGTVSSRHVRWKNTLRWTAAPYPQRSTEVGASWYGATASLSCTGAPRVIEGIMNESMYWDTWRSNLAHQPRNVNLHSHKLSILDNSLKLLNLARPS